MAVSKHQGRQLPACRARSSSWPSAFSLRTPRPLGQLQLSPMLAIQEAEVPAVLPPTLRPHCESPQGLACRARRGSRSPDHRGPPKDVAQRVLRQHGRTQRRRHELYAQLFEQIAFGCRFTSISTRLVHAVLPLKSSTSDRRRRRETPSGQSMVASTVTGGRRYVRVAQGVREFVL